MRKSGKRTDETEPRQRWSDVQMENDPRVIGSEKGPGKGIGNFIRKTSLDEFPQFFNVLKGDSGIIGTTKKNLDFTGVSLA